MATKVKKYYEVNKKSHTVTIDTSVKHTKADEEKVNLLVKVGGYDMRFKSEARAAAMTKKADGLNAATIREALKDDKKGLAKFEAIMKGEDKEFKKGFFAARKWYKGYKGI